MDQHLPFIMYSGKLYSSKPCTNTYRSSCTLVSCTPASYVPHQHLPFIMYPGNLYTSQPCTNTYIFVLVQFQHVSRSSTIKSINMYICYICKNRAQSSNWIFIRDLEGFNNCSSVNERFFVHFGCLFATWIRIRGSASLRIRIQTQGPKML